MGPPREQLPGVAGTPRISWHRRAYSSAGSAAVWVCRAWSTLASTIWRRLKRPDGQKETGRLALYSHTSNREPRQGMHLASPSPASGRRPPRGPWAGGRLPAGTCVGLPRLDELLEQLLGDGAAGLVVLGHPEERLLLPHPVLQHLRRRLHEVPLHVRPAKHGELCLWGGQSCRKVWTRPGQLLAAGLACTRGMLCSPDRHSKASGQQAVRGPHTWGQGTVEAPGGLLTDIPAQDTQRQGACPSLAGRQAPFLHPQSQCSQKALYPKRHGPGNHGIWRRLVFSPLLCQKFS